MKASKNGDVAEMVRERDAALKALDADAIRAYSKKYGFTIPRNHLTFWAGVHKARCSIASLSETEKEMSRDWLRLRKFEVPE